MPRDDDDDGFQEEEEEEEEEVEVEEEVEEEFEEEDVEDEVEAEEDGDGVEEEEEEEEGGGGVKEEKLVEGFQNALNGGGKASEERDLDSPPKDRLQIPLNVEAKEVNDRKSLVSGEIDNLGNDATSAIDPVSIIELDHRRSPVSRPSEHVGSLAIRAFGGVSSAALDLRRSPVTVQTEYPVNHARSILDPVRISVPDYRTSPVSRQMDNPGNHARSTLVRSRSPSADVTFETGNKRPLICDFYSKGWCIKGNSCRFLHQKDHSQNMTSGRSLERECSNDLEVSLTSTQLQRALVRAYGEERSQISHIYEENGTEKSRSDLGSKTDILDERALQKGSTFSGNLSTSSRLHGSISSSVGSMMYDLPSFSSRDWDPSVPKLSSRFESGYSYPMSSPLGYQPSTSWTCGTPPNDYQATTYKTFSLGDSKQSIASAWEPSVPFRSSFCPVPLSLLSAGDQYDPLIDSIEPAKENIDLPGLHRRDLVSKESASPGYNNYRFSGSFSFTHDTKTEIAHEKELGISVGTNSGPDMTDVGNRNSTFDGLRSSPGFAPDLSNIKKDMSERNPRIQEDRGNSHKESKALKIFRAAVADFVKDLLKPSWVGGHLSKDTHKLIVKKAVEKVCGALQPHQIPSSNESTNQYFFSNRPKLVKLVEGYVEKYSKS